MTGKTEFCFFKHSTGARIALLFLLGAAMGFGQAVTGTILGRITDASGAVVPGATILIENTGTGFSRTEQSDRDGQYSSRNLPLGDYSITISQQGFQTQVRRGIVLTVASEQTVNAELVVGAAQQKVEVTAAAQAVETTNAEVSSLVTQDQMRDLPLNGRSVDQLALLNPGVFADNTAQRSAGLGSGLKLSVNGSRVDAILYLLDGTVVNDHSAGGPGSATKSSLGVESILEFRLLTHNFSAEYGRVSGGVMSQVTRSGTNQLHGSAYEFVRNNVFDARNFFNPGGLPPYRRNQFGAAAGGAVVKDRVFFFANYEGLRTRQGVTINIPVPDLNARKGLLPNPTTGQLQAVTVNPAALPYVNLFPVPNGPSNGDGTAQYLTTFGSTANEDYSMERMDFRLTDKDNMYWRYVYNPSNALSARPVPSFAQLDQGHRNFFVVSETHIFSGTSVNDFRAGFNRTHPQVDPVTLVPVDPSLTFVQGQPFGRIQFSALGGGLSQLPELGVNTAHPQNFPQNIFQESDTYSTVHGAHSLKVGIDVERIQLNVYQGNGAEKGSYRFGGLQALLAGTPNQFTLTPAGPNANITLGWRRALVGWFIQDDYRLRPNLTLNLGLRHEFFTTPNEVNGDNASLINVSDPALTPGPPFISPKLNFSPRVGLAWDPFGDGRTAVRAGAGLYFNHLDGRAWYMSASNLYTSSIVLSNPVFPNAAAVAALTKQLQAVTTDQYHMGTPSVAEYSLEVQRDLGHTFNLQVGYIGAAGYKMGRVSAVDLRIPTFQADGTPFFPSTAPRSNPNFSNITYVGTDGHYNYNGLQVVLNKALAAGLNFQATYTWSKAMSNSDTLGNSVTTAAAPNTLNIYNPGQDYSQSVYDQRQTLILTGVYRIPLLMKGAAAKAILGGWAVNGIYRYGSGLPFDIQDGFNNSQNGDSGQPDRPSLVAGASNNPINGTTVGCPGIPAGQVLQTAARWFDPCAFVLSRAGTFGNLGRNTVTGPGTNNVDFTLIKNISVTERIRLEFRFEVFDLFNHVQFTLPNLTAFTSSGTYNGSAGQITTTATDNREIQLGLKLIF